MKIFFPIPLSSIAALLILPSYAVAMPTVSGDQLTWSDSGWHQVQRADTFETICEGNASEVSSLSGGPCIIDSGKFIVINHATGERFDNISASNDTSSSSDVTVEGNQISWPDNGWYQLQDASSFATVCEGGQTCTVDDGDYVLINHTTGERFNDIRIGGSGATENPDNGEINPASSVAVTGNTIRWPDNGWYQVQNKLTYASVCEGGTQCEVSPGNYIVINHTNGERQEVNVPGEDASVENIVVVDFDINVPVYVSNELQVSVSWGNQEINAAWQVDELWYATGDFPSNETQLLTVTFYDRNGQITLGSANQMYTPRPIDDDDNFDLVSVNPDEFDTDLWDDDADGFSNIDELRRGTDPLVANSPSSYTSFDLAAAAPDLTQSLAGYQLEQFSYVVDDLAFLITQQTTITWPDNAYYQVQHAYRFTTLCEGGPECKLVPGSYLVINHDTGERDILDIPYRDPAELSNNVMLTDTTLTLNDTVFETDSVNVQRRQYQCELGGSLITSHVGQNLDTDQSDYHHIAHRKYSFDQCKIAVRDSLIPDGIYLVQGSMREDKRNYGGYLNVRNSYRYDGFSLVGENGLEYRIDGNTEQAKEESNPYILNRSANITEYQKVNLDGQVEEWVRDSRYRSQSSASSGFGEYELEMNGQLRTQESANQWVTVTTNSPLMQHWHSPSSSYDHPATPLQGSYQMQAEDGSSLLTSANPCFVDEDGNGCPEQSTIYVDVDYLAANGEQIQTIGVKHETPPVNAPTCVIGNLRRTHINPGEPYVNASDEGRLECTAGERWHTDIYDRYTFGSVILPERSIIIP